MHFLVVDDHAIVRRGLREVLAEGFPGCRLAEAATAEEALAQLEKEPWDLILLDLNIPGRSGLEVLEEARRRGLRARVLVLTAYPEEEYAVRCLRLGAAGYLTKHSAAEELLGAVRKVLGGGRYVTASLAERLADLVGGGATTAAPHELLSTREMQVLRLVATGRTAREIAAELHLSDKTVATYRARIADKLGLSSLVELTRYAILNKLVD